jgi:hypothetical protein
MHHQVRTKWHRLIPLVDTDEVYLTSPPVEGGKAPHWSDYGSNPDELKKMIHGFSHLPKFVIDPELLGLIEEQEYQKSLLDMKRAGVMRLPFPQVIVEYGNGPQHTITLLEETKDDPEHQFGAVVFHLHRDVGGEYLVVSPAIIKLDIRDNEGEPWIKFSGDNALYVTASDKLIELSKSTFLKDTSSIWYALASVMLLMATAGVKREVIEVERLNKSRVLSGKEPIPRHTYISIGHVYRRENSEVSDEYIPRRSPRPHWRRGHLRMVRFGKGYASSKQVYIGPKLVAYQDPTGAEPSVSHEYVVTK